MADSNIGSLPVAESLNDDSLFVAEQSGEAVQVKGRLLRTFAENAAKNVRKGDKGDPGEDFKILGYYDTPDALKSAVGAPNAGDAYGVGTEAPYDIYVWDGVNAEWVNNGTMQGEPGQPGKDATINGVNALTLKATGSLKLEQTEGAATLTLDLAGSEGQFVVIGADGELTTATLTNLAEVGA